MQALYDGGTTVLNTDIANAFGTMSRRCIYDSVAEHLPKLVRWFLTYYGSSNELWLGTGVEVGKCHTGVLQGDPLAMLLFSMGFQRCITATDDLMKQAHVEGDVQHTLAYADDAWMSGDGETLLDKLTDVDRVFKDLANAALKPEKSKILLGKNLSAEEAARIRAKAALLGVPVLDRGMIVMGIPVGSPEFIKEEVGLLLDKYSADAEVLKPFTVQQQCCLLKMCINARPTFLRRAYKPGTLKVPFAKFDEIVTRTVSAIAGVPEDQVETVRPQVHMLRSQVLSLGGCGITRLNDVGEQAYATGVANGRLARYLEENHVDLFGLVDSSRWNGHVRYKGIRPVPGFDPDDHSGVDRYLGGHPLGNIPGNALVWKTKLLKPNLQEPLHTEIEAWNRMRMEVRLIAHSQTLQGIRSDQNNNQLVAQSLSASVLGSGAALRWFPVPGYTLKCGFFRAMLQTRLCLCPWGWDGTLWQDCNCCTNRIERICPDEDVYVGNATAQPLHGLMCRKRGCAGRVVRRHNEMRDTIASILGSVEDLQVRREVLIPGGGEHRADLKVSLHGAVHWVDIGITCPASLAMVDQRETHLKSGAAAKRYYLRKLQKYAPVFNRVITGADGEESLLGFVPFICETGGFIAKRTVEWLDQLLAGHPSVRRKLYSAVANVLDRHHGKMLVKFKETLA